MSKTDAPILRTERLLLRLPAPGDAAAAAELLTDPEVMRRLGGTAAPLADVPEVIAKWQRRWEQSGLGPFVVERRADGRFLGRCGLLVWDTREWTQATLADAGQHAQPELGWAFARAHWGNGYATEAARGVRAWACAERAIDHLISLIAPDNAASQRVARRLRARPTEPVTLFDSSAAVIWVHPEP